MQLVFLFPRYGRKLPIGRGRTNSSILFVWQIFAPGWNSGLESRVSIFRKNPVTDLIVAASKVSRGSSLSRSVSATPLATSISGTKTSSATKPAPAKTTLLPRAGFRFGRQARDGSKPPYKREQPSLSFRPSAAWNTCPEKPGSRCLNCSA